MDGPEDELRLTQNTQPAILIVSYSIFSVLKKEFNFNFEKTKFFAGHSLGEYSALVCAESLDFHDALYLLFERGKSMQESVLPGEGAMLAILGMSIDEVESEINSISAGKCEIANDNCNGQVVVSGKKIDIDHLKENLKKRKKKEYYFPSAPHFIALL